MRRTIATRCICFLILLAIVSAVSCAPVDTTLECAEITSSYDAYSYRLQQTGVYYLVITTYYGVGVAPMYNSDGTLYVGE